MNIRKVTVREWVSIWIIMAILIGATVYFVLFFTPKNSRELYQDIRFAKSFKDVQKLMLEGYEGNFTEEDYQFLKKQTAKSIRQFTLFEYKDTSYVIMTTDRPKLEVIAVEQLQEELQEFFNSLDP